jgi:hypothetical protein
MSLKINSGFNGITEPEVQTYIEAVEAADQQLIEFEVAQAINTFVRGCKNDGIWDAIKASCILAGARTLEGALVPLKGTAPTNFNFVSGDYDRKTGLVGDGSTKYLDSNSSNTSFPENSRHFSLYKTNAGDTRVIMTQGVGADRYTGIDSGNSIRVGNINTPLNPSTTNPQFIGGNRNSPSFYTVRANNTTLTNNQASNGIRAGNTRIFGLPEQSIYVASRIAFYSIGESLDLALLDSRVTTLINTFNSVIPS